MPRNKPEDQIWWEKKMNEQQRRTDDSQPLSDLLPCPFCGATVELYRREDCGEERDLRCNTEGCFLQYGADWWLMPKDIIRMWNTRQG